MPQQIEVPGTGIVEFPDGMSDDAISAAIKTHIAAQPSVAADVAKSAGVGVGKGAIGLAGLPGDVQSLSASDYNPFNYLAKKFKESYPERAALNEANAARAGLGEGVKGETRLPTSKDIQSKVEETTGEFYKPQTRAGRYTETAAEFLPGAAISGPGNMAWKLAKFGALPGVASERAGEATEGTKYEPYARVAAALAAPFAPGVGRKIVTPFAATPRQTEMVERLADRGVTSLTAGERTGSETLQALETKLGNTIGTGFKAEKIADQGERQFTKAAMSDLGESGMATKPELQGAKDRVVGEFNRLSANNLNADMTLVNDMATTEVKYRKVLDSNQKPIFDSLFNDILDKAAKGGMTGEEYQIARSQLGSKARGLQITDPESAKAFKGLQKALDDNMERGLSPTDKIAWRKARDQYGRLKDVEGAVPKEGSRMVEGIIEPAALNRSISSGKDASAAARGQLPFSDLAEAGAGVMVRPGRNSLQHPTAGGYVVGGPNMAIGNLLMSKLGQGYTGNQIITGARAGSPSIAAIAAALTASQNDRSPLKITVNPQRR